LLYKPEGKQVVMVSDDRMLMTSPYSTEW